MQNTLVRIFTVVLAFSLGVGAVLVWMFYLKIPDVTVPETNIGCNYVDTSKCNISENDKKIWEEKILSKFKEKSLVNDRSEESYRLVLLPTFDAPIAIRIYQFQNQKILVIKKLSGEGGFGLEKFGKLSYEKTKTLTDEEWNNAINLLEQMSFWNISPLSDEIPVTDGATWVLEGKNKELSHQIERITPVDKFKAVCSYFLKLSESEKDYKEY